MSDIYTYPSEQLKQVAVRSLKEDPNQINAHVESFRRWVRSMPHLNCPTDGKFLLMFLRVAKFDHSKAQKRLDNFCTMRSTERGSPEFFKFSTIPTEQLEKIIRAQSQIPIGITRSGEYVVMGRMKGWNPKEIPIKPYMIGTLMAFEVMLAAEETQVTGMKMLVDMDGCGRSIMESWSDPKLIKSFVRMWQDCYPSRFKGYVVYREPGWYTAIFNMMEFFLNQKFKNRVYRIKDDMSKAFENIPGLEDILPIEYGGKGPSLDECTEMWLTKVKSYYENGLPWANITVNEKKRPAETLKYLTQYPDYTGNVMGQSGTFTKFDVF